jgi:hypothetical protein
MGIAIASYEQDYVDFGTNKRSSDGGVIERRDFYEKSEDRSLNIPQMEGSCDVTE